MVWYTGNAFSSPGPAWPSRPSLNGLATQGLVARSSADLRALPTSLHRHTSASSLARRLVAPRKAHELVEYLPGREMPLEALFPRHAEQAPHLAPHQQIGRVSKWLSIFFGTSGFFQRNTQVGSEHRSIFDRLAIRNPPMRTAHVRPWASCVQRRMLSVGRVCNEKNRQPDSRGRCTGLAERLRAGAAFQ